MPRNYIVYQTWEGTRKIAVVHGQPYYQSTGKNSSNPGVWFPFILIGGKKRFKLSEHFPPDYNKSSFTHYAINGLPYYHILKLKPKHFSTSENLLSQPFHEERIPTKQTLIVSTQLGSPHTDEDLIKYGLTDEQIAQARSTPIRLRPEPDFSSTDEDIVNQWLIKMGAILTQCMLSVQKPVPKKKTKNKAENTPAIRKKQKTTHLVQQNLRLFPGNSHQETDKQESKVSEDHAPKKPDGNESMFKRK